ncbi:phosphoadenylyl-sulfate reductase [Candidatus Methylopumilus rimovensis]|uniref:Adenosine 5'-phosphosulfate reductase n=1 Tax=Candidatus Methylopumilus rimovensis TaxID=2588535 RepID=A0AAE6FSV1_9PROT|nr:phosphoadenylyl-sulfate reductase [Candidatus Methylopumilus rimovensis]QDD13535.1 phosphoadenylyl-sulfate reductase [Candidatus Methylopumilus rimovensis]
MMIHANKKHIDKIDIDDELIKIIDEKSKNVISLIQKNIEKYSSVAFANSLGAEDMVLIDLIQKNKLSVEAFSIDTGRLPPETYNLIQKVEDKYQFKIKLYFPDYQKIESYVNTNGINAFYNSVDLRKSCCAIRKVEPLNRALKDKKVWITGMRQEQSQTRFALKEEEFDEVHQSQKLNPLSTWSELEVWAYIKINDVPYNTLHDQFYPSIGCAPCTRAISAGEDIRAGRWWWEDPQNKECGLHVK